MTFKPPNPYKSSRSRKYICKKCGYSEVVLPTSDMAEEKILGGIFGNCPKCGGNEFYNKKTDFFDVAITLFFQNFRFKKIALEILKRFLMKNQNFSTLITKYLLNNPLKSR